MADMDMNAAPAKLDDLIFPSKDANDEPMNTIEAPDAKDALNDSAMAHEVEREIEPETAYRDKSKKLRNEYSNVHSVGDIDNIEVTAVEASFECANDADAGDAYTPHIEINRASMNLLGTHRDDEKANSVTSVHVVR